MIEYEQRYYYHEKTNTLIKNKDHWSYRPGEFDICTNLGKDRPLFCTTMTMQEIRENFVLRELKPRIKCNRHEY